MTDDSYVYTYANSLDSLVFYVGKGAGKRCMAHIKQAESGSANANVSTVAQKIRSIWQQGGKVIIRKPHRRIHELEALKLEKMLIEKYGYEQLLNKDWHACHKNQWCPPKGRRNGW